ncbi:MAG TPA: CHAT domain-containing protein [Microbacterium sp.]|nr:CHAT domain-containing protein [Microbacterium sp.]
MSTLSIALALRFGLESRRDDIDRAVELSALAVALARQLDDARLDERCLRAGATLADRFESQGDDQDLVTAVEYFREALAATEPLGGTVSGRCADLARALLIKYGRWARVEDLDEAATLYRRAIDELPAGHYEIASHKSGLGGVLVTRYEHYGDSADLAPAIELLTEAYELTDSADPAKPIRLGRLAEALIQSHSHFGAIADLDNAIRLLEFGLEHPSPNTRIHVSTQVTLAGALRRRGLLRNDIGDLGRTELLLQEVAARSERAAYGDASLTFNLASVRSDMHSISGEASHLSSAIAGMREALAVSRVDSPLHSHAKTFLAQLLLIEADDAGVASDSPVFAECLALSREAAVDPILVPALGLISAATWAELADGTERLVAYDRALAILPYVSSHGLTVADSLSRLRDLPSVASDACAAFVEAGQLERAVEALEEGRAIAVRLRMRRRTDVEELRRVRADLAEAYEDALEGTNHPTSGLDVDPRGGSRRLEELLAQIREITGFARFGFPRTFREIQALIGDAMVVYLNTSSRRCDALVVTATGVTVVSLSTSAAEIAGRATDFLSAMEESVVARAVSEVVRSERVGRDVAAWLWDAVVHPVLDELQLDPQEETTDATLWPRVWWIPTGHLAVLPIQSAGHHAEYGSQVITSSHTAIDRVVSSQIPSIETLAAARQVSDDGADDIRCLIVASSHPAGESILRGVDEEVERLVAQLGRERTTLLADQASLLPDGPSTKVAVLSMLAQNNWAHFACHASPSPENPTESQLILTDHRADPLRVEDLLTVRPIAPRLAYFSACSTAQISPDLAHEPVHFGIAAALAGYAHSVLTLWPVRDDPEIADAVYKGVLRAMSWPMDASTGAAVHDANRMMRKRSANAIHRWAATIHQGS